VAVLIFLLLIFSLCVYLSIVKFSGHEIKILVVVVVKCSKIHTASSACLNDNNFLILAIHHAQDQIILALRATDEVVAALY